MKITAAEWRAGKLTLTTSDPEAVRFAHGFEAGDYSLAKAKRKRSNDSNSYLWILLDKLAAVTGIPKTEIYRRAVKEIGGNSTVLLVRSDAADDFCQGWEHNGIGWPTEREPSSRPGYDLVIAYYGSSTYDSATMSRLINLVIQDAKALGIETMTPQELERLKGYEPECRTQ